MSDKLTPLDIAVGRLDEEFGAEDAIAELKGLRRDLRAYRKLQRDITDEYVNSTSSHIRNCLRTIVRKQVEELPSAWKEFS